MQQLEKMSANETDNLPQIGPYKGKLKM